MIAGARHGARPDGVPAREAAIGEPMDISALPDGSYVVASLIPSSRVLRVDAAGIIRPLAGGGSGWREGAPATSVSLGSITAAHALADGRVLIGGVRGVLQVDPDGRIRTFGARHVAVLRQVQRPP